MVRGTSSFLLTLKTDSSLQQRTSRYGAEPQTLVHFFMQGQVLACEDDLTHIHTLSSANDGIQSRKGEESVNEEEEESDENGSND